MNLYTYIWRAFKQHYHHSEAPLACLLARSLLLSLSYSLNQISKKKCSSFLTHSLYQVSFSLNLRCRRLYGPIDNRVRLQGKRLLYLGKGLKGEEPGLITGIDCGHVLEIARGGDLGLLGGFVFDRFLLVSVLLLAWSRKGDVGRIRRQSLNMTMELAGGSRLVEGQPHAATVVGGQVQGVELGFLGAVGGEVIDHVSP